MSLMRRPYRGWSPVNGLIERHFDKSVQSPTETAASSWALDMYETTNELVVKMSVPGIDPEDIEITIEGSMLTIKGETKSEEKVERQNYVLHERHEGSFERSVALPGRLIVDDAVADFEHGVLTLSVPKAEEAKAHIIKINAR